MRRTPTLVGCLLSFVLAACTVAAAAEPLGEVTPPAAPAAPAASATPSPAAPAAPAAPAPEPVFPYTGYMSGDIVNVRCGPGRYYYPLQTLSKDTQVVVEAESNGWLALRPPEGVYGLIRKGDVTMGTGGTTATVSATSARVYASSPAAKRQWCVMTTLKQGDSVTVLGTTDGDMVRIAPPADAHVFVVSDYVAATGTRVPPEKAVVIDVNVEPPKADPLVEAFQQADQALKAELAKPIVEREYEAIAAKFKEIAEKAEKDYVKAGARKRVALIEGLADEQKEFVRVTSLANNLDQRLADIKGQWASKQAEADRDNKLLRRDFLATGLVAKMESLADVDYPIKHKLVDQNNRPLVVLKSTTYELDKYVGKVIGVRGTKKYLKEWQIYLVDVDDVEVLEE